MPTYSLKDELAKAARITVYGSIAIANDPRQYIRANSHKDAADAAMGRLKQLAGDGEVTALHFKQAIEDFSVTREALIKQGDTKGAQLASKAFDILVQAYLKETNDADVYLAQPEGNTIDMDSLAL